MRSFFLPVVFAAVAFAQDVATLATGCPVTVDSRGYAIGTKDGGVVDFAKLPKRRVLSTGRADKKFLANPDAPEMKTQAPNIANLQLFTTQGIITIELHRDWSPHGVDRFYNLVRAGYFDDARLFRVIRDRWAQFGIAADPQISQAWRTKMIPDDPRRQSNVRGTVAFAFAVPNGRTTQVFINLRDNAATHDKELFVPMGRVVQGMNVADCLYSGYGETSGGGIRAGKQDALFALGNTYLQQNFPKLDWIKQARIVEP